MVQLSLLFIAGLFVGTVMIALGGGGGSIYLGVLTGLVGLSPRTAAATSIITALPALAYGSFKYWRRHLIHFKIAWKMIASAVPSIFVGYFVAPYIPTKIYSFILGLILVVLGIQLMIKVRGEATHRKLQGRQQQAVKHRQLRIMAYGILAGLMVGIAGLSGGAPIQAGCLLLGVPLAGTSGTSSFVLVVMSVIATGLHLHGGGIDFSAAIPLIIGALVGANFAPRLILWISNNPRRSLVIQFWLAVMMIFLGGKTALG